MLSRLVHQQRRMPPRCDRRRDRFQMQRHAFGVAPGQDERGAFALLGTDRAKDVGRRCPLVLRRRRTRTSFGPTSCNLVFLADARLVGEPDLYAVGLDVLLAPGCVQARRETSLKASTAPFFWAW